MNENLKNEFHEALVALKRDLETNLREQTREYDELTGTERTEPGDEAQARMQSHNRGALTFHDEERLTRVRSALGRLENGTYGTCAACSGEISPERLRAKPEALLCIDCERRHEAEGGGAAVGKP